MRNNFLKIPGILFLLCAVMALHGQTLSPQAYSTSGGYTSTGTVKSSWTIGQAFFSTIRNGDIMTQGFQQPEIQLRTSALSGTVFCAGSSVIVPYTALDYKNTSNVFTAQLSNASGSFVSPVTIGTVSGATSGNITAVIPSAATGAGYRIRVVSSIPAFTGPDNGTNLTINPVVTPSVSITATPSGAISAGTSVTFTATPVNGGAAPVYTFYVNGIQKQSGTSATYTTTTLANGNTVNCIMNSNASCASPATATSNTITMIVTTGTNTWTGAVSTDWATAGNWTIGVPSCSLDALIPGGLTNYPLITATASVRNLTINSGATLTQSTSNTLSICGNLVSYGSQLSSGFQTFAGSVILQGTGTDSLIGNLIFNNLQISGNYSIISSSRVKVSGVLNKATGTFATGNMLTLLASSTQTAYIADNGGSLTGNAYIQQYVSGLGGYHHISGPLSGATLSNITTGVSLAGTDGVGAYISQQEGSMEVYKEPVNIYSVLDSGYYNYTNPSNPLTSGLGLSAAIRHGYTVTYYGAPANGNINYTITRQGSNAATAGWNLIGNPYPEPLSWTGLRNGNPGVMNATAYIWVPTSYAAGSYQAYNGSTGVGGANDVIALGQGFFVYKNAAGSTPLSFTNAMRFPSLTPPFYKTNELADEIRLTLSQGIDMAEIVSYTQAGTSLGLDNDADGPLPPSIEGTHSNSFSFVAAGQKYLINVFDRIQEDMELPLSIHAAAAGSYTISARSLNVNDYPVLLLDKAANKYYDLSAQNVTFNSAGDEDKSNYSIVFKKATASAPTSTVNIWGSTGDINISRSSTEPADIEIYDVLGRVVAHTTTTENTLILPIEVAGVYVVRQKESGRETVKKVMVK